MTVPHTWVTSSQWSSRYLTRAWPFCSFSSSWRVGGAAARDGNGANTSDVEPATIAPLKTSLREAGWCCDQPWTPPSSRTITRRKESGFIVSLFELNRHSLPPSPSSWPAIINIIAMMSQSSDDVQTLLEGVISGFLINWVLVPTNNAITTNTTSSTRWESLPLQPYFPLPSHAVLALPLTVVLSLLYEGEFRAFQSSASERITRRIDCNALKLIVDISVCTT